VLTNAGGPGILAADALEANGLDIVQLNQATVDRLRPLFPAEASIRNPLDMIASATPAGSG
jgi:acetyltransferase